MKLPASIQRVVNAYIHEREQLRRLLEVVRHGLRGLVKSQIPRMAAALAFRTLFSLIPVLVVGAVVMGAFLSDDELRQQMDRLIEYVGLDTIMLEEGAGFEGMNPDPADAETGLPIAAEPAPSARLDEWIAGLVERVSGLPFKAIGFVGVLVLLYGAIAMLVELETAFNQIYGGPRGRSWITRITTYWTTLTLGVVFLLATFSVGDIVAGWVASIGRDGDDGSGWVGQGLIQFGVNAVINTLVLLVAYSTVPSARVHIRPALAGAVIAGFAWEFGKVGFTQYVQRAVGGLEQLYGVLALLPLFMLWVYITWVVVLFGLQVAYSLQTFGARGENEPVQQGPIDPSVVLVIAKMAAERFEAGETLAADDVVERTGVPGPQAEAFLRALCRQGVLRETEGAEGVSEFVLGRPPSRVEAAELIRVARSLRLGGTWGGLAEVDAAVDRATEGLSLADLGSAERLAEPREPAGGHP